MLYSVSGVVCQCIIRFKMVAPQKNEAKAFQMLNYRVKLCVFT